MRVPIRKPGKYTHLRLDPHITQEKCDQLKNELEKLKTVSQPQAIKEVQRLAELGDFSENAAYQMAKGRLRGINERIHELEKYLKRVVIITPIGPSDTVQLGSRVTIELDGQQKTYLILGSAQTDPLKGVISQYSPLGAALMAHRPGDVVQMHLGGKAVTCRIISIA